jgi:uncharacterized protein
MRNLLLGLLLLCQLLFSFFVPAGAAPKIPPRPTTNIYVVDRAGVLSNQTRETIAAYSRALELKTKAQIVVLTVPSLDGAVPADYALTVLREWGIGDSQKNNGVLLLVAVKDRKSRIEVGYGLEGTLPDGLTGRIQDQYMLPYFRQGDYDKGILNGYAALLQTVAKGYGLTLQDLNVRQSPPSPEGEEMPFMVKVILLGGIIVFFLVDHILFGGAILRALFRFIFFFGGGRGGGFGGGYGGGYGGGSGGGGGSDRSW